MQNNTILKEAAAKLRVHKVRNRWYRLLSILMCVSVFVTTYVLIMPALTLENDDAYTCGMTEHTHSEGCYERIWHPELRELICGFPEEAPENAGDPYLAEADTEPVTHVHTGECYRVTEGWWEENLVCGLSEHEHDMGCLVPETELSPYVCGYDYEHTHTEDCYLDGVLICTLAEHTHSAECLPLVMQTIESAPAADGAVAVITGDLPAGAEAQIEAVYLTGEELIAYVGEAQAALMKSFVAYDIRIMAEGEEWQPGDTVSVVVRQTELTAEENDGFAIAHVDESTNEVSNLAGDLTEDGEIVFDTDGFSLYIFYTYTVDFHYGDLSFSISGRSAIRLSALFAELGITESVEDVADVVFSDPTLLRVEPTDDGDWLLTSLAPFSTDETLVITFADERSLVIGVTDAQDGGVFGGGGETQFADLKKTGDNQWQLAAQPYEGNERAKKIKVDGASADVYIQKNVVPTDKENEFFVYLSIDTHATVETVFDESHILLNNNKGTKLGQYTSSLNGKVTELYEHGDLSGGNEYPVIIRVHQNSSGPVLYTYEDTRTGTAPNCANGTVFLQLPGMTNYLAVQSGVSLGNGGETIVMDVYLETAGIQAAINETLLRTVTDELGDYVELVEYKDEWCDGSVEYDESTRTLTWTPVLNEDVIPTIYATSDGKTDTWNENAAQLIYKVRLCTEKPGFKSCAGHMTDTSGSCVYPVNSSAEVTYYTVDADGIDNGDDMTGIFPVPAVRGLHYDLRFRKVDAETKAPISGVVFRLLDANGDPITGEDGSELTYRTDADGCVFIPDQLAMPAVYVEEVSAPLDYEVPANPVFGPLPENYTENPSAFLQETQSPYTDNMYYVVGGKLWEIENTPVPVQKVIFRKIDALTGDPLASITFALCDADDEPLAEYGALVSGANGIFSPADFGLPDGTYHLMETETREGYEGLSDPIEIVVSADGVAVSGAECELMDDVYTITVENERIINEPIEPPDPTYVPDEPVDVTLTKQIDWLGDNEGAAPADTELYRLYLSLETENIEPMDLLLVVDQSTSMTLDMYGHEAGTEGFTGESRQYYIDQFLNGNDSDGFIAQFLDANSANRLAILTFGSDCSYTDARYIRHWDSTGRSVYLPDPDGATNYAAALDVADQILDEAADSTNRKVMIFLSDGVPTLAYQDGKMHRSFAAPSPAVGFGDDHSVNSMIGMIDVYQRLVGGPTSDYFNAILAAGRPDDSGILHTHLRFLPYNAAVKNLESNADDPDFPVHYDFTTTVLPIPGTEFPNAVVTDAAAFNSWKDQWNGWSDAEKLAWVQANALYPGDKYDIFWLTESAFAEFAGENPALPVFTLFFSADADQKLASERPANEVLQYMAGDEGVDRYQHYQSIEDGEKLAEVINSIAGLSGVRITDPLSEYVDVAEAPELRITMKKGSETVILYENNAFTEDGVTYLDTENTVLDPTTKTLKVVFRPEHIFSGEFTCEASFNVRVSEAAYETYAVAGCDAEGDANTDYGANETSSGKPGFFSNDGAKAEWYYYGDNEADYDKPVVQVYPTDILLQKVSTANTSLNLPGARFELYREVSQEYTGCETRTVGDTPHYLLPISLDLVSGDAPVTVEDLLPGRYYLFETKAPAGYHQLAKPVVFDLDPTAVTTTDENAVRDINDPLLLKIQNESGKELPSTGGSGNIPFVSIGLGLMAGSLTIGILLRRRRERRRTQ